MKDGAIKVVHVINSFEYGGAEAMLCNLLLRTDRERFEPSVVALIDDMTVADPVRSAGIPLCSMRMKPGVPDPRGVLRLARHLARERPAVVQTWMDHSNLIGGLASRLATRAHVVWGIHHSNHVPGLAKRSTLLTVSACARLSRRVPSRVVFCSELARTVYVKRGFEAGRTEVVPNGFDTEVFRPDPAARLSLRRELGLDPDVVLVGLVARYDPLKDHSNFLRAAAMLAHAHPETRFVLCGDKVDARNEKLASEIESLGLSCRCLLLGPRRDVARIHAALDVATSSSMSEAFPLAVGETMSCGVPCVATDVGDSALIVGNAGRIVPPGNPRALALAWVELLAMDHAERLRLGRAARSRIQELFDLGAVTRRYEGIYSRLVESTRRSGVPAVESGPASEHWTQPAEVG